MYKLRDMEYDDLDWVVNTVAPYTISNDLKRPELYNSEQLTKVFNFILVNGLSYVCEHDGEPVGIVAGLLHGHVFNPEVLMATSVFWFVDPEHRNTRAAHMLLSTYNKEVARQGRENIFSLQDYSLKSDKYFSRMGFVPGEKLYRKGI